MSKLDDIFETLDEGYTIQNALKAKQQIKDLMYAIISEANSETYDQGKFYRELRKKVEEL